MTAVKKWYRDPDLIRILTGGVLLAACLLVQHLWTGQPLVGNGIPIVSLVMYAVTLLLLGAGVFRDAVRGIFHGELLDETFLMSIASVGAFFVGEYEEGVAVMLFYLVGEYCEHRAVRRSRSAIRTLMDINPDRATVLRDGAESEIASEEVQIGDTVVLHPGSRVPVDCVVLRGNAAVNTAALTGESMPLDAAPGTELSSGMIVNDAVLYAQCTKPAAESAASRILELVEEANDRKSRQENFITAFSHVYTPVVVVLATLVAFLPSLIAWNWSWAYLSGWIYRALMFLVVSCPCALVVSVPLAFFGGIGNAAGRGILFKGGASFDSLTHARVAVFDKTGTLTTGTFSVSDVRSPSLSRAELLRLMGTAEYGSTHPIARAIREEAGEVPAPEAVREVAGKGVIATVGTREVAVGNRALMEEVGAVVPAGEAGIFCAVDGVYNGCAVVTDTIKPGAAEALAELKKQGVAQTVMLTGDRADTARRVADTIGIDRVEAELLPQDKYSRLETLMSEADGKVIYAGDGINDAPTLARADVGIAMGGIGSDAAIEAADVVIMNDDPRKIPEAMGVARRTIRIAKFNIVFALIVKVAVMVAAATGLLDFTGGMWVAVFADVGVALLAILNSLRAVFEKPAAKH